MTATHQTPICSHKHVAFIVINASRLNPGMGLLPREIRFRNATVAHFNG